MSRLFGGPVANEYLELDQAPVTAAPLTMACWFIDDSGAADNCLMQIGDKDVDTDYFRMGVNVSGMQIRMRTADSGGGTNIDTTTTYSTNTWTFAAVVQRTSTDRDVYINTSSPVNDTTDITPAGADRISIGREGDSTPGDSWSGNIAHAAVWSTDLSDDEIRSLAQGFSPLFVDPVNLVAYYPLLRTDKDWVGGYDLTAYNTPSWGTTHPPVIMPAPVYYSFPGVSATLEQEGFRWRKDDGSESGAGWHQNQDVDHTIGVDNNIRLRILINATGDPASQQYTLEYKETSDGAAEWRAIPLT